MSDMADRDIRQRDLIPPDMLSRAKVTVVGVGAIGRQVAIQLAAIGVPTMNIVDFDDVQVENLSAQGFMEQDLNLPKVKAVGDMCHNINSGIDIATENRKFRPIRFAGGVLMCCVDKIDTRKSIFNSIKDRVDLYVDGRMSAEYMRILTVFDEKSGDHYAETLFPSAEAHQGSCTAKSTIYCSNIAAGMMVSQFVKWLRNCQIDQDIDLNLLTNELGIN